VWPLCGVRALAASPGERPTADDERMTMDDNTFTPGESVTWLHEQRGGYGFIIPVPATVVKATAKRVVIDAALRSGGTKRVTVKPEKLRRLKP
jgi:hypothetical protein